MLLPSMQIFHAGNGKTQQNVTGLGYNRVFWRSYPILPILPSEKDLSIDNLLKLSQNGLWKQFLMLEPPQAHRNSDL